MVLRYFSLMSFVISAGFLFSGIYGPKTDCREKIIEKRSTDQDDIVVQSGIKYNNNDSIIKLDKKRPFGFGHSIYDLKEEDYYHISVWRFGDNEDGRLVADGFEDNRFYIAQKKPDLIDSAGWQLLTLDIFIPPYYDFNELKIYVWNKGKETVFFKNLKIEKISEKIYPSYDQSALKINIDEPASGI